MTERNEFINDIQKLKAERNRLLEQIKEAEQWESVVWDSYYAIEAQLRRAKAEDWASVIAESLDSFLSPHYFPDNMKVTDKMMLDALILNQNYWGEMSRPTKYKYRNMLKEIARNDELTQYLKVSFSESMDDLKQELDTWLVGLDVTKND